MADYVRNEYKYEEYDERRLKNPCTPYAKPAEKTSVRLDKHGKCVYIKGPMQFDAVMEVGEFLCDAKPPDTNWALGIKKDTLEMAMINVRTGKATVHTKAPDSNSYLVQQGDGNFLLRSGTGKWDWQTYTHGNYGARLFITCTGEVKISSYHDEEILWSLRRKDCIKRRYLVGSTDDSDNSWIEWHQHLCWNDKMFGINGNDELVYWKGGKLKWPKQTFKVDYLEMRIDGELIAGDEDETIIWRAGTKEYGENMGWDMTRAALVLDDDGPAVRTTKGDYIPYKKWKTTPTHRRDLRVEE